MSSTTVQDSTNIDKYAYAINKLEHMSERVLCMKWFYLLLPIEK